MSRDKNKSSLTKGTKKQRSSWRSFHKDISEIAEKDLDANFTVKNLVAEVTVNNNTMSEFLIAYAILNEAVAIQEKSGYTKLFKKINMESKPPCNIFYLDKKIALDNYLSKATYKIYRILNLH